MPQRIPVRATRTGGIDYLTVPTDHENWVAAYQRERRGYELAGDTAGVALVDIELARLGVSAPPAGKRVIRGSTQD